MTTTPLIVTADDYGLTEGTCRAILDAHDHGIVTATSVLAVAPGVEHRLPWLVERPSLSMGVHLALVGEDPPLLTAREIPTLVDRRGALRASWRQLLPLLAVGRVDLGDVRRELGAQIDLVAAHGHPTHLDAHQHVHLWPSVGRVVVDLAVERQIGAVRVPRAGSGLKGRAIDRLADRLAAAVDAAGLARTERFCGLDEAGGWSAERLVEVLTTLADGSGSVECNVHPGLATDSDRARYDWGYAWGQEAALLVDTDVQAAVERLGYELVGR